MMNKILICKTFRYPEIGIMSIPMIKAIRLEYPEAQIDVMIGDTADDGGAIDVFLHLVKSNIINTIHVNKSYEMYDMAVLAIPYDGRWRNGVNFNAKEVIDGRTRPDPSSTGLSSWKKHEIEYQMDNAYFLGYDGEIPDTSFLTDEPIFTKEESKNNVYIGVGYKKDAAGFWKIKHWGNENYANLIRIMLDRYPNLKFITTGDKGDLELSIKPIKTRLAAYGLDNRLVYHNCVDLNHAFRIISSCDTYIGNDTGSLHAAASCNKNVIGIFNLEHTAVKNHPWCKNYKVLEGHKNPIDFEEVISAFEELNGK